MIKILVEHKKDHVQIHPVGHRIYNLTPHPVTVNHITFPPSGKVARVEERVALEADFAPFILRHIKTGKVVDLPPKKEGVWYIVSRPVALAAIGREDLLVPDEFIRDEEGKIIGARYFATFEKEGK